MRRPPEGENVGVRHGRWGEAIAVELLRREGYEILERNVRPNPRDRRLEIDIVAYDRRTDRLVFVEVKQHASHSDCERRLRSVDRRKKRLLKAACRSYLARNRWQGEYRFDVIEVYGTPESRAKAETDHIEHVNLFTPPDRFVNWEV